MCGWEPASFTRTLPDGRTMTTREPEWDWIDRAILASWHKLDHQPKCRQCGRPMAVHEHDSEDDYNVGYLTCTATAKLDRVQAEQAKRDEAERDAGRNPDRARQWVTWTDDEGAPTFTDD